MSFEAVAIMILAGFLVFLAGILVGSRGGSHEPATINVHYPANGDGVPSVFSWPQAGSVDVDTTPLTDEQLAAYAKEAGKDGAWQTN